MHVDHNMHVIGCNMHVTCTLFRIGLVSMATTKKKRSFDAAFKLRCMEYAEQDTNKRCW